MSPSGLRWARGLGWPPPGQGCCGEKSGEWGVLIPSVVGFTWSSFLGWAGIVAKPGQASCACCGAQSQGLRQMAAPPRRRWVGEGLPSLFLCHRVPRCPGTWSCSVRVPLSLHLACSFLCPGAHPGWGLWFLGPQSGCPGHSVSCPLHAGISRHRERRALVPCAHPAPGHVAGSTSRPPPPPAPNLRHV